MYTVDEDELKEFESQVFQLTDPFDDELCEQLSDEYHYVSGCYRTRPAPTDG